jgi:membrane-associated protein
VGCFLFDALARASPGYYFARHDEDFHRVLESILHFLRSLYDPEGLKELIHWGGPALVCAILFVETGLFVGFFLPGDSLLVTAGIFSGQNVIPLRWLLIPGILCAIAGDQLGYWIGRSAGPALYRREDSFFFRRSHLQRAHEFYERYGGRAVILARFVPIVRTFCPPVAGAAQMPYLRYLAYDTFGGIFWVGSMVLGGYLAGSRIPNISKYLHLIIGAIILLSILPPIIGILRSRRGAKAGASQSSKASGD